MPLIKTVSQSEATGVIKEGYDLFNRVIGFVPKPFELFSASPGLFKQQLTRNRYYGTHPRLTFPLLVHIRFLVSCRIENVYCQDFNRVLLQRLGLGEAEIDELKADPSKAMLEEHELAMLLFVLNAVQNPGSTTADEVGRLEALGWEQGDLLDALVHGLLMVDLSVLMKTFQMEEHCLIG